MPDDTRNVVDEFKGVSEAAIIDELDGRGIELEIALENIDRDFSMGSIIRSANAFGVRNVHIIGKKQWNKRGAMATDKYLHVHYYNSVDSFISKMHIDNKHVIAIDNIDGASDISSDVMPFTTVLVFGSEKSGVSQEMISRSSSVSGIRQRGSTRSMNVGAAAAIAMYEWCKQHS